MSLIDITCGDCGAHYRLDVALLKGEKGARIRCRKCGGRIVVRLPEESPAPVKDASPKEPTAFKADISGMFRSEPASSPEPPPQETGPPPAVEAEAPAQEPVLPWPVEPSAPLSSPQPEAVGQGTDTGQQEMHDPGSADPVPSGMPGTVYSRLEDLFASPGTEAGPDRIPPPPEEYPAGEYPPEETAATEPERTAPSRRAPSRVAVLIISVLWILLLAGGAFYFGTMKSGQDMLGKLFAGWGSGRTGGAPARPVYDIRDVKWHVDKSSAGGSLFVIRGSVANVGTVPSAGIRIQATLLGKDNEVLAEKAAFAGNLIDEASLGKMDRAGIEGVLSNRFGEGNVNREIPKDKALPFMVVFFDPAGEIGAVVVKAMDAR